MTVSASRRSSEFSIQGSGSGVVALVAAAYLAAHLPFLAPSLEDIDSINFALGLRHFAPALHQPHPPGYPVYIALGRVSLAAISATVALARDHAEALAFAIWSALAGALAIMAAARLFTAVALHGHPPPTTHHPPSTIHHPPPIWAAALLAAAPLFWMCGLRPMSDMPGLGAALAAQALLLEGLRDRNRLAQGAFIAGVAAGIRVQTLPLTVPLLLLALVMERRKGASGSIVRPVGWLAVGILAWGIPLIVASGGVGAYLHALGTQAGEDFAWVDMLWAHPAPKRVAFALRDTLVRPWGSVWLFAAVAVCATAGAVAALARARQALGLMLLAFVPYLAYHLLLQDTATVRYAVPVLPLVAWLAAQGLQLARRWAPLAAVPLVGAAVLVAVPGAIAYGREPHPVFRAIADADRRAEQQPPAATYAHFALRRPLQAAATPGLHFVEPRRQYEWMGLVNYWRGGGTAPIWFLADPLRTDVELIDSRSRLDVIRYRWAAERRPELHGTRPMGADWYRFTPPGWMAGEGWSLTPETGGLARATAAGPGRRPIEAWVRRRPGPMHLVVGGSHLGNPGDPDAEFELTIDGVLGDRWRLTQAERNFLRFVDVPTLGSGPGSYAHLVIASHGGGGGSREADVAIRQFDAQPATELITGFGDGWHDEELEPDTGVRWRWTSERSIIRLSGPPRPLRLTLRGESPRKYFATPPTVRIVAAGRLLGELHPDSNFTWRVDVPADAWAASAGAVAIETTPVYLPGPAEGTSDQRHLGLRLFDVRVTPVLP